MFFNKCITLGETSKSENLEEMVKILIRDDLKMYSTNYGVIKPTVCSTLADFRAGSRWHLAMNRKGKSTVTGMVTLDVFIAMCSSSGIYYFHCSE